MNGQLFDRRVLAGFAVLAGVSLLASLVVAAIAPRKVTPHDEIAPSVRSRSAIGHKALYELLRKLDIPASIGPGTLDGQGVVIVWEPREQVKQTSRSLDDALLNVRHTILVLPKWRGTPDPDHAGFAASVEMLEAHDVDEALSDVDEEAYIVREDKARTFKWEGHPDAELPLPQLVHSERMKPILGTQDGMAVGLLELNKRGRVLVIADPDLVSNHGLWRGHNAEVALALIDEQREGGMVAFDESHLGGVTRPGPFRALFTWPLILFPVQLLLVLLLLLWAALVRFGQPARLGSELQAGGLALVDSAVALQRQAGRSLEVLDAYLNTATQEVAERLHAPRDLLGDKLAAHLDGLSKARGLTETLHSLDTDARTARSPLRALKIARRIHAWRKEMLHGTR